MNDVEKYEKLNPFTAIWTRPRAAVRHVIEEKSSGFIFLLIVLAGFAAGLLSSLDSEQFLPVGGMILIALFFGPIGVVVSTVIGAGIYLLIGKLFKGKGTYTEMFRAILTGLIPQIWLIPIILLWMLLLPETYFLQADDMLLAEPDFLSLVFLIILGVISAWTFFVQCKAVAEAHRFSAWKGFFVIMIPTVLVIGVIIGLIALFFTMLLPAVGGAN
ncbi:Yip1 family protein [Microbacterium sp. APC 3898]|uniref:Yip1 family protein n=1 Tax=Planococcus notacanthi TaxID=3035188 RepID=A0ABT7ZKB4_9BACL|nr:MULTISPECIES: Yip1 family protein [Terrabacteria group]MBF6634541.1 YIP1 family protein [Planococcus sp. (in: firmicutes)]MDN3427502.1 Yip1 family protein [Planococcus sp. APC 4016]MDN3499053.1 Yip1 family protein [Microbacterium sp. APC 3898]